MRLTLEEVVALDMSTSKAVFEYCKLADREVQFERLRLATIDTVYFCGGGMKSFAINAYGEMGICVMSQQETFDVRQAGVEHSWQHSLEKVRMQKRTRLTKCINCRIQSLCGMCAANAEMENGDKETPVDFLCQVAHLRAMVIGNEISPHGECGFCAGGDAYVGLLESVGRIQRHEVDLGPPAEHDQLFPILNNLSHLEIGCGGCESHS